jgi:hypothetical protein
MLTMGNYSILILPYANNKSSISCVERRPVWVDLKVFRYRVIDEVTQVALYCKDRSTLTLQQYSALRSSSACSFSSTKSAAGADFVVLVVVSILYS